MKKINLGFTLLELLVAMVILAILASIAVPAFDSLLNSTARRAQLVAINAAFQFARGESVSKRQQVVVCSSVNGNGCGGSADWSTGWVIFLDRNGNGVADYGTATCDLNEDCLLKSQLAMPQRVTLTADSTFVNFSELGEMAGGASVFTLCSRDADPLNDVSHSHTLSVAGSGAVSVALGSAACP